MNKVAIVGFGFMGKTHYAAWGKTRGAKVVAICDANLAQLTAAKGGNAGNADEKIALPKAVRVYDDFSKLIAAGGFDVVDVTLPTPLHEPMTVAALKAGYHVFCEKPMSLAVKSCDRMIAAAKRAKKLLFVGQCVRFFPEYAFLKEAIDDGRFGKVVAADFTRFCPLPGWNNGGKSWFLDETKSGGAAVDMHVHDADFIQYAFGKPPAVSTRAHKNAAGLTDHLVTTYLYKDKLVTADTSWAAAGSLVFDAAYRVFFEKATVYCGGRYKEPLLVYPEKGEPYAPKIEKDDGYLREIRYFNDLLSGRVPKKSVLTARDARNSIKLVLIEKTSAASGRPEKVKW